MVLLKPSFFCLNKMTDAPKFDRLNKDIEPPKKEGYTAKFTSTGWKYNKIVSEE